MFTRFFFYFDSPPFSLPATDNGVLYTVPKLRVLILHLFFVFEQLFVLCQDYGRTSFSNYRRQSQNTNIKPF